MFLIYKVININLIIHTQGIANFQVSWGRWSDLF